MQDDDQSDAEDGHRERGASRMDGTASADDEEEHIVFDQDAGASVVDRGYSRGKMDTEPLPEEAPGKSDRVKRGKVNTELQRLRVHEDFNFEREQGEREEAEAAAGDAGVRDDATSGAVVAHAILYESFAVPPAASLAWPAGLRGVDSHLAAADYAARYGLPPMDECVLGVPLRRLLRLVNTVHAWVHTQRSGRIDWEAIARRMSRPRQGEAPQPPMSAADAHRLWRLLAYRMAAPPGLASMLGNDSEPSAPVEIANAARDGAAADGDRGDASVGKPERAEGEGDGDGDGDGEGGDEGGGGGASPAAAAAQAPTAALAASTNDESTSEAMEAMEAGPSVSDDDAPASATEAAVVPLAPLLLERREELLEKGTVRREDEPTAAPAPKRPCTYSGPAKLAAKLGIDADPPERSEKVLALLAEYIESCGGSAEMVTGWFTKTEFRKDGATAGTSYAYYFDTQVRAGKRRRRGRVLAHCPAC